MAFIHDDAFDAGLDYLRTNVENFYLCSAEPTTFAQASTDPGSGGYKLGTKASPTISSSGPGSPTGRKLTVSVTGGAIGYSGTAIAWAITDNSASKLLATGLCTSQAVTNGNTFDYSGSDITITDATDV